MPQRFLSIKNFEKYQKTKNKEGTRPWIKLWKSILQDPEFMNLTPEYRYIYIMLILLADDTQNKVYADSTYLRQRLYMTHTEGIHGAYIGHTLLDLRPLYRSGFLSTTNLSRALSEERREEERREEAEAEGEESEENHNSRTVARPRPPRHETDEEFLARLEASEAYAGIPVRVEWEKCLQWCVKNLRQRTQKRFINWLNRIERVEPPKKFDMMAWAIEQDRLAQGGV